MNGNPQQKLAKLVHCWRIFKSFITVLTWERFNCWDSHHDGSQTVDGKMSTNPGHKSNHEVTKYGISLSFVIEQVDQCFSNFFCWILSSSKNFTLSWTLSTDCLTHMSCISPWNCFSEYIFFKSVRNQLSSGRYHLMCMTTQGWPWTLGGTAG